MSINSPGDDSVLVLGHTGFLGNALYKRLKGLGINCSGASLTNGFDIRQSGALDQLIETNNCNVVINCAAKVGGIEYGRRNPAVIFRDNLQMTLSILESASKYRVKLINPISNCAYPKDLQVFKEENFWDGSLDESVLVYGSLRKIGWVGAWAYAKEFHLNSINLVFPNMYGPGDHLDPVRAHALGALVYRILQAKFEEKPHFTVWGSGKPVREWMYVEDAVDALILAIDTELSVDIINIGTGKGISIRELSQEIARQIDYSGEIRFDIDKPDGAPYKTMDGARGQRLLGWEAKTDLESGISETIAWYANEMKLSR